MLLTFGFNALNVHGFVPEQSNLPVDQSYLDWKVSQLEAVDRVQRRAPGRRRVVNGYASSL